MFSKIFRLILKHKIITGIILLLIIAGYFGYQKFNAKEGTVHYAIAAVEKGTLIVSVSGSGQVSASRQVDIKTKASGEVIYFNSQKGQEVKKGMLLLKIDDSDAQKAVRDAEINLQSAELNLQKMKGITNEEGTIRGTKEKAEDNLEKAYEDGFNTVSDIFLNLPTVMAGMQDILFSSTFALTQDNIDYYTDNTATYNTKAYQYKTEVYDKYQVARRAYDQNFQDYKSTSRLSEKEVIESLINETYETVRDIAEAIKSANNLIQLYKDELTDNGKKPQSQAETHLSNLASYTSKTNSYLLNLLFIKTTIESSKESVINSSFDIADQEIQVKQKSEALAEAEKNLGNYSVYIPFDGVIAETNIEKGDSVSSATTLITLISHQKIAEISLNEVDATKLKIGQKATVIFDAIEDFSITGEVIEIDTIGTVSQGVVSYNVKIKLDTQDERVKPGMSLSATIITDAKQNALLVSNSAVKQQGDMSYVEVVDEDFSNLNSANVSGVTLASSPRLQEVEVGLCNDTQVEIVSGLKEGDKVITQTINSGSSGSSNTSSQGQFQRNINLRIPGL